MAADAADVKIVVHWLNGSRAQSIIFLLEELLVPYELKIYHRGSNMLAPPELAEIHPLGKSPVITIERPGSERVVLAESAFIIQYLCDHFSQGKTLVPPRWKDGQEGKVLGETEMWMRYQYLLYYVEGTFMTDVILYTIMQGLKGPSVPFLVRPITKVISDKLVALLAMPNFKRNLTLLESMLAGGNKYICGDHLTAADILFSYPIIGTSEAFKGMRWDKGSLEETYPNFAAYAARLPNEPGWLKSAEKIRSIEGDYSVLPKM